MAVQAKEQEGLFSFLSLHSMGATNASDSASISEGPHFFLCAWMFALHLSTYIVYIPGGLRSQKRASDPLELEL